VFGTFDCWTFAGVFNSHGQSGAKICQYVAKRLPTIILEHIYKTNAMDVKYSIEVSFDDMQEELMY